MNYGCNYSNELMKLLQDQPDICDYIKIGAFGKTMDHLESAFEKKPLLIHGFGWHERGGMSNVDQIDFRYMNLFLERYKSPFLAMHALAFPDDLIRIGKKELLIEHMTNVFNYIQKELTVPLLIENLDYSPYYKYETTIRETVEPLFLSDLITKTGAWLLFDLSHAKVSAYQLKIELKDYIEALPLEKMKEIHFSGSFYSKKEGFKDIHGIMDEEDYRIAEWLSKHPRVVKASALEMVTLEYGTVDSADIKAIGEQMKRLKHIFNAL